MQPPLPPHPPVSSTEPPARTCRPCRRWSPCLKTQKKTRGTKGLSVQPYLYFLCSFTHFIQIAWLIYTIKSHRVVHEAFKHSKCSAISFFCCFSIKLIIYLTWSDLMDDIWCLDAHLWRKNCLGLYIVKTEDNITIDVIFCEQQDEVWPNHLCISVCLSCCDPDLSSSLDLIVCDRRP